MVRPKAMQHCRVIIVVVVRGHCLFTDAKERQLSRIDLNNANSCLPIPINSPRHSHFMRIQINLPKSLVQAAPPASTDPPLVQIGGDLVVIEVQGEMTFEGEPGNKVIGLLDLETIASLIFFPFDQVIIRKTHSLLCWLFRKLRNCTSGNIIYYTERWSTYHDRLRSFQELRMLMTQRRH